MSLLFHLRLSFFYVKKLFFRHFSKLFFSKPHNDVQVYMSHILLFPWNMKGDTFVQTIVRQNALFPVYIIPT